MDDKSDDDSIEQKTTPMSEAIRKAVLQHFLLTPCSSLLEPFNKSLDHVELFSIRSAFIINIQSAFMVGSAPFQLKCIQVDAEAYRRIASAERIRQIPLDGGPMTQRHYNLATGRANKIFAERSKDTDNQRQRANEVLDELGDLLNDRNFLETAKEILRQVAVMIWGAFEVAIADMLVTLINIDPNLIEEACLDQEFKKKFQLSSIPIEYLVRNSFDISRSMGLYMIDQHRLDDITTIKVACRAILTSPQLDTALKAHQIWRLAQLRNLIVHRRGEVDKRYLEMTGESQALGEKVRLTATEIESFAHEIVAIVSLAIAAAEAKLQAGSAP